MSHAAAKSSDVPFCQQNTRIWAVMLAVSSVLVLGFDLKYPCARAQSQALDELFEGKHLLPGAHLICQIVVVIAGARAPGDERGDETGRNSEGFSHQSSQRP